MTCLRLNTHFFQHQAAIKDSFAFNKGLIVTEKSQKVWLSMVFRNSNPIALPVDLRNLFCNSFLNYGIYIRFIQKLFGLHPTKNKQCYRFVSSRMLERIESPIDRMTKVNSVSRFAIKSNVFPLSMELISDTSVFRK